MKNEPKKPEIIYGWPLYSSIVGNEWPLKLSLHDSQYVYFYLAKLKTKTKVFFQTKMTQIIHLFQLTSYPWKVVLRSQKSWIWTSNYFSLFWYTMVQRAVFYCNSLKTSFFRMPVWLENTIVNFYIQAYGFKMNEF